MTAGRWAQITSVFRLALDKPAADRAAFLDQACGSDETLRRNVERLLAAEAEPSLLGPVPEMLESGALEFVSGEMLAQYRMEVKLGEGGMGAVYRCYDTRLRRPVALKVLAPERFADLERKRRLLREARAASGLNHPNIVTIYEVGSDRDVDFIAMECVEGKRLDELIPSGGLEPEWVVRYAAQIAGALAHAHAAGILHRDLKPSNLMIAVDGRAKVLDFSLAKSLAPLLETGGLTEEGTIAGTAAYMSPEQAEGRLIDHRSDIFSFGTVLYEMATGRRPFTGESRLALLGSIVNDDPQPPGRIAAIGHDLEQVILHCLRKDPSHRYQSMADLKTALEALDTTRPRPRRAPMRAIGAGAAFIALLATAALFGARLFDRSPETRAQRTVKFTITPANLVRSGAVGEIDAEVSISRDGKHIAYVESEGGQLWIRDIDQEQPRPVPGAIHVYQVFWSPDNRFLGYSTGGPCGIRGGCDLVKIPVEGGTPTVITRLDRPFKRASWSSDGETILFCDSGGMYTVPSKGGPVTRILEHPHIEHPSFLDLPDGRKAYLYQTGARDRPTHTIYVQVAGEERQRLIAESSSINPYPAYSPTGHIVYADGQRDSTAIWAIPFSLKTLQTTGKPFPIAQHGASPAVSLNGTLVYGDVPSGRQQLIMVDRAGRKLSAIGEPQRQSGPTLSPDGRQVAVEVMEADPDLWVYEIDRGVKVRLTSDRDPERPGVWEKAGDRLTYSAYRGGNLDIFSKSLRGSGEEQRIVGTPLDELAPAWSPDGRFLMYSARSPQTNSDLLYRERDTAGNLGEPAVFLKTPSDEAAAQFSPDGRFVAYVSDASGRSEVYVRDFPKGATKWQISANGGIGPRWSRDGKEIFFVEQTRLLAAPVTTRPAFSAKAPAVLFENRLLRSVSVRGVSPYPEYDVTADAQRFVVLDRPAGEQPLAIHVIHNWFEEFRGR